MEIVEGGRVGGCWECGVEVVPTSGGFRGWGPDNFGFLGIGLKELWGLCRYVKHQTVYACGLAVWRLRAEESVGLMTGLGGDAANGVAAIEKYVSCELRGVIRRQGTQSRNGFRG